MSLKKMTKQQHKDIWDYIVYAQNLMFLNDWDLELSEIIGESETEIAKVWSSPLKKEASIQVTEWFFKDTWFEQEWKPKRSLYLIHELSHLLVKDMEWAAQPGTYEQFLPPCLMEVSEKTANRSLERVVESVARIIAQFAKPFKFTPEAIVSAQDDKPADTLPAVQD